MPPEKKNLPPEKKNPPPKDLATYWTDRDEVRDACKELKKELHPCVIVGHDPQMSWLLQELAGIKWYTLTAGELMLLEEADPGTGKYRTPRFVLSPSDPGAATALREKIKSKMDTAKVLGAFFTGLLAVAADALLTRDQPSKESLRFAAIGLTMFALAIVLYFVTLFLYDALLMPTRFWSSRAPKTKIADDRRRRHILRPPGPDVWVLYEGMLRVWTRAFVPATLFAGLGVALLTLALADPIGWRWWQVGGVAIAVAAVGAAFHHWAQPKLGGND